MDHCQVHLKNFRVTAYHGIHEEEKHAGTDFIINLSVTFPYLEPIHQLDQTLNYVLLSNWVKQEMKMASPLLETVAENISAIIKKNYPQIIEINITITKLSPPVINFQGDLGISLIKKYS